MANERIKVVQAGRKLYEKGLVTGTWGNISIRIEENPCNIAVTPSGMDYENINEEDVVIMDLDGSKLEGMRKPSTEFPLHRRIYNTRDDIKAVIHTHSTFATAIACVRMKIPPITEEIIQLSGGDIETVKYELPGSEKLSKVVASALKSKNAALLANHGSVAIGGSIKEALIFAEVIEKNAKTYILSKLCGEPKILDKETIERIKTKFKEEYGQT